MRSLSELVDDGCDLPFAAASEPLRRAIGERRVAVVETPPGTGKTTLAPPVVAGVVEGRRVEVGYRPDHRVTVGVVSGEGQREESLQCVAIGGVVVALPLLFLHHVALCVEVRLRECRKQATHAISLQPQGEEGLLDLAFDRALVGQEQVLGQLLRQRRAALHHRLVPQVGDDGGTGEHKEGADHDEGYPSPGNAVEGGKEPGDHEGDAEEGRGERAAKRGEKACRHGLGFGEDDLRECRLRLCQRQGAKGQAQKSQMGSAHEKRDPSGQRSARMRS